jgi:hypothetical protein
MFYERPKTYVLLTNSKQVSKTINFIIDSDNILLDNLCVNYWRLDTVKSDDTYFQRAEHRILDILRMCCALSNFPISLSSVLV